VSDGPPPAGALVAVLERKGRFLTAEPVFPRRDAAPGTRAARGPARMVVGGAGSSSRGEPRARAGDLVLVQRARRGSGASVVRVIGRPDVARDMIEAMLLDRGLSRGFGAQVERQARGAAREAERSDSRRRDLTDLPTFTIDPAGAGDYDDAISAEQLPGGLPRVWVHIADVAAHVPPGSPLDVEARRRATSVYVPGTVEPMLPHALSSDACSLLPGSGRRAVTVELELDGATVTRASFYRSLIRSDERLDYDRVQHIFDGEERAAEPWGEPLRVARSVASALADVREHSGALVLDSEEPEFSFDEHGNVSDIRGRSQSESHRVIEHLMICANEAVASLLAQRGVPCLYRVHERPDPERIARLADQLATLQVPTPPLPDPMSPAQAADLVGAISRTVDTHVRRTRAGRLALTSLVLRSLKQAYYSPRNIGHAGLHSSAYCHFTSPIRRYPDLVCHRALLSAVGGGEREPAAGELVELGAWSSEREREAMRIERDGDDIARCFALEQVLFESGTEQVFTGEITGLISAGAFVAFGAGPCENAQGAGDPAFEGMLPVRLLRLPAPASSRPQRSGGRRGDEQQQEREWWELNEQATILRGERTGATLRLGDRVKVRVARVDSARGRVDLTAAG
jgi:ribonuclease R